MDEHFEKGQAAGLAIASATRNATDEQVAELVTRELAAMTHPGEVATCVATLAKILTQHFHAAIDEGHVTTASARVLEAIRVAFADEQTTEQLTDAVLTAVADLNRNEVSATLASFVVAHYHLDSEGDRS